MTRAVALVVVAACAASAPTKRPPRIDPITRLELQCEQGDGDACIELASRYERGWRLDADEAQDEQDELAEDEEPRDDVAFEEDAENERVRRALAAPPRHELSVDLVRARELYGRACTAGSPRACYEVGRMRRDGVGGAIDLASADAAFASGCLASEPRACTAHAIALKQGLGIAADPVAGYTLMRETCDAGHPRACANVGVAMLNGDGVTRNEKVGHDLLRRSCMQGDSLACVYLADLEERTVTKPHQMRRVLRHREDACMDGLGAGCAAAARMYQDGLVGDDREQGMDSDERMIEAARLYDAGCKLGDPDACQGLYLALVDGDGVAQDVKRAARMAEAQCRGGHAASCQSIGYFYELGLGVARDLARAELLYRKACDAGPVGAGACSNLGELLGDRGAHADAILHVQKGCDLGDARGCNAGGAFIASGQWPADRAVGLAMLRRACELARGDDEVADYCGDAARIR